MVSLPPETCNVAFKEWSGVCDALIQGRQTLILRKGGISEGPGPGRFAPEHTEFWLYPTWTHQSQQGLRSVGDQAPGTCATAPNPDGSIPIRGFVRLEFFGYVMSEASLAALRRFHCLEDETIRMRFHYRKPGLWVLAARVWQRDPGFSVLPTGQYAGCTTWVYLDVPLPTVGLAPAFNDSQWAEQCRQIKSILSPVLSVEDSHDASQSAP
jgi:hypothetical protein